MPPKIKYQFLTPVQVFESRATPLFKNNETYPTVAILVPYRSVNSPLHKTNIARGTTDPGYRLYTIESIT